MVFDEILNTIENDDMKKYAEMCLDIIPPYILTVAASSTGKYHPQYALGEGGLARHTCAVVRFLNHTFAIECMNKWTSRERDILRIAGMMHDSYKSGSQVEYEQNKYTKHEHPLLAAEAIRHTKGCGLISDSEIELIAGTISAHMGSWNTSTRSSVVLPTPQNKFQKMLHWADYLASRKDIEVKFDDNSDAIIEANPETWTFPFGKFKGQTFNFVKEVDPGYLNWLYNKADMEIREPLKTLLENFFKEETGEDKGK